MSASSQEAQNPALPSEDLGGPDFIRVAADGIIQRITVQVPNGLQPTAIRADWQRTAEITRGSLTVEQDGRSIAAVEAGSAPLIATTNNIALTGPRVVDDTFTFDLRLRPSAGQEECSPILGDGSITLNEPSIVFSGNDAASDAVSDFLPTGLQRLVISVPAQPSTAHSQAAFDLANVAVRSYGLDPARIDVTSSSADVDLGPLERRVIIDPSTTPGVTASGRTARVGGDDATVVKNVNAFGTRATPLSQVPTVNVTNLVTDPITKRTRYSFNDIGIGSVNLDGVGRLERTLAFSQADLGGPVHNWSVRLVGQYEPQVSKVSNNPATFSVLTNGTLLRSVPLNESGQLDVTVHLPDQLAGRDPSLTLRFDTEPADSSCEVANAFTASIDARSAVDVERGDGAVASGFTRWPQSGLPKVNVAFDTVNVDALAAGVATIALLQDATRTPIAVDVADKLDETVPAPRLAVVTQPAVPDFLDAILPGPGVGVKLVGDNGQEIVSIDANETLSSLQAYKNDGETLVLAGPSATDVRSLAATLASNDEGWFSLRGDTYFKAGTHEPASIQARGGPLRVEPVGPKTSTVVSRYRAAFIIGSMVLVIALLALLYPRMVQSRPGGVESRAHGRRATDNPEFTEASTTTTAASPKTDE
jgi:hypothetical protein